MADLRHQLQAQHAAVELAAEAIAEALMTQHGRAGLLRQQVCSCDTGDLRLTLLAPGLLFVTENLLLLLENIQLGLVCFPLPHAGPRSEETLRLTVCGRSLQLQFWSPRAVHKWLAAPMRAQVPVLPSLSPHATSTAASPAVHGNLALQGCQGCFQARQLESLADAVARRIGDFAAALVSAADTELTSLRAAASQADSAAADSDSTIVSSNSSCAGSESLRQRQRQADTGTEASDCREDAGVQGVGSTAAAVNLPAAAAAGPLLSPFGRFASSGVSPTSPGALADSDASRRGSGDDAGSLLFGDDNFAGSAVRARRKLSAALTASPRSRDRSPRLSSSLPTNSTLTPLRRMPEQESSHYVSVDSSARRHSRSSGDSRLGAAAAMSPLSEVSHQQLQTQVSRHLGSTATRAGDAEQDLSSSQRLSLQSFLQSQLELSHPDKAEGASSAAASQQQAQQQPPPLLQQQQQQQVPADLPELQPMEQDDITEPAAAQEGRLPQQQQQQAPADLPQLQSMGQDDIPEPAAAEGSRRPSAASQSPGITSAAMAEAAASALEAAASALRAGAAASTAAAECLPPTGTIVQAGAAAGAAVGAVAVLAAAAPAIAPAATETVKSAIGDAATTVVTAAAETAKVAVEAAADAAVEAGSNIAAAAAGPAAEGAAAATCTVAETAAETAGPAAAPLAQGAADAVCVAAEAAADAVVPAAASGPAVALVGAAGAAAAGLAGLTIQEQPADPASSGDVAARTVEAASAGSDASAKQQRALSSERPPSPGAPPLEALRGGDCSSSTMQEPVAGLEGRIERATSSQLTAKLGHATPFSTQSSREKCAVHGTDETACCGAAGTSSCKCWQALSAPWIAFRSCAADRSTLCWQPSSQLQVDAAICVAVLLACLGLCLAPRLLVVAVEQLVPHAALVACLAAAPLLMMVACSHWYLDHREAVLSSAVIAAVAVFVGAGTAHLRAMFMSRLNCWYSASCSDAGMAQ